MQMLRGQGAETMIDVRVAGWLVLLMFCVDARELNAVLLRVELGERAAVVPPGASTGVSGRPTVATNAPNSAQNSAM